MEDVRDYSDGYTEAWYLPGADDILATTSKVRVQGGCPTLGSTLIPP
jgi:hypothetical protein